MGGGFGHGRLELSWPFCCREPLVVTLSLWRGHRFGSASVSVEPQATPTRRPAPRTWPAPARLASARSVPTRSACPTRSISPAGSPSTSEPPAPPTSALIGRLRPVFSAVGAVHIGFAPACCRVGLQAAGTLVAAQPPASLCANPHPSPSSASGGCCRCRGLAFEDHQYHVQREHSHRQWDVRRYACREGAFEGAIVVDFASCGASLVDFPA